MDCKCGERMVREWPLELLWDYWPGSIEVRQLVDFSDRRPGLQVWACLNCGQWMPTG